MNNTTNIGDVFWVVFSGVLVLIMQLGFLCFESGVTRSKNSINVAMKNAADFVLATLLFWLVGFGLMYGQSVHGLVGASRFAMDFHQASPQIGAFFFFQAMFCSTAVTVVSGAVAERIEFHGYLLIAALITVVIYPVAGHWAWSGAINGSPGWLAGLGFVDFAGSTVVHSLGGWVAAVGVLLIGAREGRFVDGMVQRMTASNVHLAFIGLLFFIVGWVGFNGGSTLSLNGKVPAIIVNTMLAAAAGASAAYLFERISKWPTLDPLFTPINGCLAGLVAITAGCHAVSSLAAAIIGSIGALVMIIVDQWLLRARFDDAVGAIGVHLGAGIWGTLAVALFGNPESLNTGLSFWQQLGAQALGVLVIGAWSFGVALLVLGTYNRIKPLRVSVEAEREGLNIAEHGARTDLHDLLRAMDNQEQSADISGRVPVVPFTEVGQIAERYNRVMVALENAVKQTQAIVRDIRDGIVTFDKQGILTSLNPAAEQIFNTHAVAAVGRPVQSLFESNRKIRQSGPLDLFEYMELDKTVETLGLRRGQGPFRMEVTVTEGVANGSDQYTAVFRDVHDKRQIEEQLFKEQERALVTLGSIADGVITTDQHGLIVYLNPAAERLTDWDLASASNCPFEKVYRTEQEGMDSRQLLNKVLTGRSLNEDFSQATLVSRNGIEHAVSYTMAPIKDKYGHVFGAVVVFHDVTSARALQRQLSYQATHDNLTGILNRSGFEVAAQKLISRSAATKEQHILGFLDLDRFKFVNDTCGHQAGDELLRQIAQLIKRQLRGDDTLARLGGDEFAVLLHNCDEENGIRLAEIIREAIAAFRFSWGGKQFSVGASIGLVKINQDTPSLPKLMSLADSACYAAKDDGRNRVNLYRPNDLELAERRGQIQWVSKIRHALDQDMLRLFCQPIAPLQPSADESLHVEVFVRMLAENGKLVPPGAFIPTAERYSLIQEVDMWVVKNTLAWLGDHQKQGTTEPLMCAINLSGATISDKSCLNEITAFIERYGVEGSSLCFEITETAAIGNFEAAKRFINALKAKGCYFSLDDFGSGLSSFGYLKNLPVDFLKIDGVFIKDIATNRVDRVMVQSINTLGHELGLKTIAEFVESKAIVEQLEEIGVDYLQGYYIAEPRPLETVKKVAFMPR
ncbi:ammonium transporter [Halioxenophilus sp. WMMB6]|uniref:ammonium transporter n=1 Tax=Halioxenophilus sp. WMMB6 TaxID=3073815 RepID=UPI00295E904F|nr:ammonium transporter [Halioxenophilus sp. WMMB6]